MNILILGSGAREHAIARALNASPSAPDIFCCATTYNPGIKAIAKKYLITNIGDIDEVATIAKDWGIQLAVVGPESPLARGISDALNQRGIKVVGPTKKCARIETSKSFTRELMNYYQLPGAVNYRVFNHLIGVRDFLSELGEDGYVIKADGLMGGKGVKVAGDHLNSIEEAVQFCEELVSENQTFVIEEKLIGQEFSLMCFSDGHSLIPMPLVQDHKRAFENDVGPNTGGMGSYSAADHLLPFLSFEEMDAAMEINQSIIDAVEKECREKYVGILYGSFIVTRDGVKLIEYNARFGDPEAMNVLSILETDFVEICDAMVSGKLSSVDVKFRKLATVCKYAVPKGYPDHASNNDVIELSAVQNPENLYFAAVNERDGNIYTTNSRSIAVVGIAKTISEAEKIAEAEINLIKGPLYHRKDIGTDELIAKKIEQMREITS